MIESDEILSLVRGALIGEGAYRKVYEWLPNVKYVLKVETGELNFANVIEWELWKRIKYDKAGSSWLAPCVDISRRGSAMLQHRTRRIDPMHERKKLPLRLPVLFTDIKLDNWGWLNGKIVCHDYGNLNLNESHPWKMRKVVWDLDSSS